MLKKKTIFISASSSGIGYHLAKKYSLSGYKVIINGTNLDKLRKSAKSLKNCDYFLGDLTNLSNIKSLIRQIKRKYKFISVLICNLGNSDFKKNNKDFEHAFKYNFHSAVNLIEASKNILKKNSKIICISSICGEEHIEGAPIGYSIAKSSLNFFIKLISKEMAKIGITINGVVPGNILFKGSSWDIKLKNHPNKTKRYIKKNVPINKFGSPDDIFGVCKLITESDSQFITGSLIRLDGGQTKSF